MLKQKIFRFPPRNDRRGFTLSEILITLAVMGLVMALTIPSLTQRANKNTYVAGLKKTYGMLDTATNQIMSNNAGTVIQAFSGSNQAWTKYGTILEFNKTCWAGSVIGNCWATSTNKLSGGAAVSFNPENYFGAVLADGSFMLFTIGFPNCNGTGFSINLPYTSDTDHWCGSIIVDINGFRGPNTFGRDQFLFSLGANGLYPGGDPHTIYNLVSDDVNCNTTDITHNGYGCASKVLNEQAMNY